MAIGVRAAAVRRSGWASTLRSRQPLLADFDNIALRADPAVEAVNPYICRSATQAAEGPRSAGWLLCREFAGGRQHCCSYDVCNLIVWRTTLIIVAATDWR